jgi:hypothetical protein
MSAFSHASEMTRNLHVVVEASALGAKVSSDVTCPMSSKIIAAGIARGKAEISRQLKSDVTDRINRLALFNSVLNRFLGQLHVDGVVEFDLKENEPSDYLIILKKPADGKEFSIKFTCYKRGLAFEGTSRESISEETVGLIKMIASIEQWVRSKSEDEALQLMTNNVKWPTLLGFLSE